MDRAMKSRELLCIVCLLGLIVPSWEAVAETYPARPITLVVPFTAGGPTDVLARTLAASMTKTLGQTLVVENKPGAGGTIGAAYAAKAAPNGYTFLLHHTGMATAPSLYRKLAYNPLQDFEYVGQVVDVPMTLVARKDFPPAAPKELFAYLRTKKENINLANAGPGSVSHLCAMLLQQALGVQMTTVAYQGGAPALTALVGGHVDLLCDLTTETIPHIKAGRIKLYAATTRSRISALPDIPTMQEAGLKDFEVMVWHGIYAPKGTPKEALDKFGAALRAALKDASIRTRLQELGAQFVPESKQTPAGLRDWLKAEIDKWTPIIKQAGVYAD
jgi:tripartite-type tricarboxylate transporter receptor subunit TctC